MGGSSGAEVLGLRITSLSLPLDLEIVLILRFDHFPSHHPFRTLPRHFRLSPSSPHKGGPNPITLAPVTYVERLCTDPRPNRIPPD